MIGLGTYAFFWQHSDRAPEPLDLRGMLERTRAEGVDVFQICDFGPLLDLSDRQVAEVRAVADDLGITLELGTRGIRLEHLRRFLGLAGVLGASLVRSMLYTPDHRPPPQVARELLEQAMPDYEAAGVTLALETYEQVSSIDLVALVESVASPRLGICLDPANTVAALENPIDVIDRCAALTRNVHVKDFAFTRRGGWVGFTLEGAGLGTGLLDYPHLLRAVDPDAHGINQIVEHWLPWQDSFDETARLENLWNTIALDYLRSTTT